IEKIIKEKMELPSKIAVRISGTKLNINNLIFELSHYQENIEYITDIQIEPINDLFSIKILEYLTNYPEPNAKIIDLLKEHEVLLDKAISQSDSVLLTVLKDKFIDEKYIAIKSEAMPQYSESEIRFAIDYFRTFIVKITDEEYVKKNIYSINEHQLLKECEFLETVLGPTNKYHKIIRFIKDNCNALTGDQAVLLGKIRASIKRRGN
ncbi:MAG: hypothetical protein KKA19_01840, partial [Candidatus Margulisbacteria bacterium]|nr:hypothetical protein [Candidatus Margulisiibacteriota bacterium]